MSAKAKQYSSWKIILGVLLLFLSPKNFFVEPNTPERIGYDLAGLAWWGVTAWLLWTGLGLGAKAKSE